MKTSFTSDKPRPQAHEYIQEYISVERAQEFLSKNKCNRDIDPSRVRAYEEQMDQDKWGYVAHSGIALDKYTEDLINGQHTLMAIVASGKGQWIDVCYNSSREEQEYMDRNKKRTLSGWISILQKSGKVDDRVSAGNLADFSKAYVCYLNNKHGNWGPASTPPFDRCIAKINEISNLISEAYERTAKYDKGIKGIKTNHEGIPRPSQLVSNTAYAMAYFLMVYEFKVLSSSEAQKYLHAFSSGTGLDKGDPILVCREYAKDNPYANEIFAPAKSRLVYDVQRILHCIAAQHSGKKWEIYKEAPLFPTRFK